jgi:hypothetical protein
MSPSGAALPDRVPEPRASTKRDPPIAVRRSFGCRARNRREDQRNVAQAVDIGPAHLASPHPRERTCNASWTSQSMCALTACGSLSRPGCVACTTGERGPGPDSGRGHLTDLADQRANRRPGAFQGRPVRGRCVHRGAAAGRGGRHQPGCTITLRRIQRHDRGPAAARHPLRRRRARHGAVPRRKHPLRCGPLPERERAAPRPRRGDQPLHGRAHDLEPPTG